MINFNVLNDVIDDDNVAPFQTIEASTNTYQKGDCTAIVAQLSSTNDVHFVTNGDFSLHDIVQACVDRLGIINKLILSTFSFTEMPARMIGNWIEQGLIKDFYALIDVRAKANYPGVFQQLGTIAKALAIVPVHAKVTILESNRETITIIGSANWTTNPRYEVGSISCNKQTAEFHKSWIFNAINDKIKQNATTK